MASMQIESSRRQVALTVIESYNSWSLDRIMSYRAPNCIHYILPASLSRPPMTNAHYRAYFSKILPFFRNFHVTLHDLIEDAAANKVVMKASSTAETDLGPYPNEYIILLYFNEEGKVEKFEEFVDSASSLAFFGRFRELMLKKDKNAGNQETGQEL